MRNNCPGFGLGLRPVHYTDFLRERQAVDWLEIISENYMVPGGKPLAMLDAILERYPVAMHGVSLSIGSSDGLDAAYLAELRALAAHVQPLWISDHLCWTGVHGRNSHDLLPLPYSEEALRLVVRHVRQVQDILGQRILLENVSSYLDYRSSEMSEWEFLRQVAEQAKRQLLLDVNNIYVNSINHRYDAEQFLYALPAERVVYVHIAGHYNEAEDLLVDTHGADVITPVWELLDKAYTHCGVVPTLLERDFNVPPLSELLTEVDRIIEIQARHAPRKAIPHVQLG